MAQPSDESVSLFDLPPSLLEISFDEEENEELLNLITKEDLPDQTSTTTFELYKRLIHCPLNKDTSVFERERYYHPEDAPSDESDDRLPIEKLLSIEKITVILCHGGYFSAAVFQRKNVVVHRTFHHYVTRKKQGGRQSSRDKTGHRPKSGGASIRRHNEQKHENEIRKLFSDWQSHLNDSDLIFTHIPGRNRADFISDGDLRSNVMQGRLVKTSKGDIFFSKDDRRIRNIPFTTTRPNYSQVRQVFVKLTTIRVTTTTGDSPSEAEDSLRSSLRSSTDFVYTLPDEEEEEEEEEDDLSEEEDVSSDDE